MTRRFHNSLRFAPFGLDEVEWDARAGRFRFPSPFARLVRWLRDLFGDRT